MQVIILIFSTSVSFLLLLSGMFKLFSIKETEKMIREMINPLPQLVERLAAVLIPVIEITVAILLLVRGNYLFVNISALVLLTVFILLNFREVTRIGVPKDCYCFGKVLKTKMGYGGLIQSIILLLSVVIFIFWGEVTFIEFVQKESLEIFFLFLTTTVLWGVVMILMRAIIERFLYPMNNL